MAQNLHQQLRDAIADGRLGIGARMPSTRAVANALGIGRTTVAMAYDLLIAEGLIAPRAGACPVVVASAQRKPSRPKPSAHVAIDPRINPEWAHRLSTLSGPRVKFPPISFRPGIPDYRYFPHEVWRRLSAQQLRKWSKQPFKYAPSQGIPELRQAISSHVAFSRAVACDADNVIVTSGAQQAFDLIARLLVVPGQTSVAVESPGYPPLQGAFLAAGANITSVPVDADGIRVDLIPDYCRIVVVTPSHQSPTGVVLSKRRRLALLDFARANDAVIVEDDYDGEFRFGSQPLDALQTLDEQGVVFFIGTFAKSVFPALRKGFVVAPAWACETLIRIKRCTDLHCETLTQSVLAAFIADGHLARHVRRMNSVYAARREALLGALNGDLHEWLSPIKSEVGLHLAAEILPHPKEARLLQAVRQFAPGVRTIAECCGTPDAVPAFLFGYGVIEADEIRTALRRVANAMRS